MNFNVYFPRNLYAFIFQLSLFYTRRDTMNNYFITATILIHFVQDYTFFYKQHFYKQRKAEIGKN